MMAPLFLSGNVVKKIRYYVTFFDLGRLWLKNANKTLLKVNWFVAIRIFFENQIGIPFFPTIIYYKRRRDNVETFH
jgi:hypothetical protein